MVPAWLLLTALWWSLPPATPYQPTPPQWSGSVVRRPGLHFGVRPASDAPTDVAVTLQLTVRTPW